MTRLGYYETITKRGIILHPRNIIWKDVYADEFVSEMRLLGYNWKDPRHIAEVIACHLPSYISIA